MDEYIKKSVAFDCIDEAIKNSIRFGGGHEASGLIATKCQIGACPTAENERRFGMKNCKDCNFFIQGIGKSGTCKKRPYVSTRQGGVQIVNGKPRKLIVYQAKPACKMFEKGGE